MDRIDDGILADVLSRLPAPERCRSGLCCRRWRALAASPAAWHTPLVLCLFEDEDREKAAEGARRVGGVAVAAALAPGALAHPRFAELPELVLYQFGKAGLGPSLAAAPPSLARLALRRGEAAMPRGPPCQAEEEEEEEEDPDDEDEQLDEARLDLSGAGAFLARFDALREVEFGRASASDAAAAAAGAQCPATALRGRLECAGKEDIAALRRAFPKVQRADAVLDGRGAPSPAPSPAPPPGPPPPPSSRLTRRRRPRRAASDDEDEPEDLSVALKACVRAGVRHLDLFTEMSAKELAGCLAGLRSFTFLYSESTADELFPWLESAEAGLAASLECLDLHSSAGLRGFGPERVLSTVSKMPRLRRLRLRKPPRTDGWPALFSGLADACPALLELETAEADEWRRRLGAARWAPCAAPFAELQAALARRHRGAPPPSERPASPKGPDGDSDGGTEDEDEDDDDDEDGGRGGGGGGPGASRGRPAGAAGQAGAARPPPRSRAVPTAARPNAKAKPACQYGAACYRKNPQHLAERNPDHLREFWHPPK
eukprot:tig00020816_g14168.t1